VSLVALAIACGSSPAPRIFVALVAPDRNEPNDTARGRAREAKCDDGAYLPVLQTLGLEKGLARVAADDPLVVVCRTPPGNERRGAKRRPGYVCPLTRAENPRERLYPLDESDTNAAG